MLKFIFSIGLQNYLFSAANGTKNETIPALGAKNTKVESRKAESYSRRKSTHLIDEFRFVQSSQKRLHFSRFEVVDDDG